MSLSSVQQCNRTGGTFYHEQLLFRRIPSSKPEKKLPVFTELSTIETYEDNYI